jgi:peptidoglycan/xylan/chitin deacetylase (PgdA/CDA1 family)
LNENAVRELYEKGHEIGMHGLTHDGKLRLDNQQELVKQLESGKRVFNDLGVDVVSFRSPWALRSSILHSALHQAGFQVDSSYPDIDTLGTTGGRNGIEYNRPYRPFHRTTTGFAVTQIWEIPSTGPQDVQIIEDIRATQDQVLEIWKRKAEFCQDFGGVFTHHSHPIHVIKHLEAYAKIIRHLKQNGFEITSMRTIAASKQTSVRGQVE